MQVLSRLKTPIIDRSFCRVASGYREQGWVFGIQYLGEWVVRAVPFRLPYADWVDLTGHPLLQFQAPEWREMAFGAGLMVLCHILRLALYSILRIYIAGASSLTNCSAISLYRPTTSVPLQL